MKTNYSYTSMQDDLEVDDSGRNRFNGLAMVIGLFIPLFVFMLLVARTGVEFLFRRLSGILMDGSAVGSDHTARSASPVTGR